MIAYNRTSLDNLAIRGQAQEAFAAGCITREENTKIAAAYPVDFYTPNIFICVGLFLLTVLITACSLGLFMLVSAGGDDSLYRPANILRPGLLWCPRICSLQAAAFQIGSRLCLVMDVCRIIVCRPLPGC